MTRLADTPNEIICWVASINACLGNGDVRANLVMRSIIWSAALADPRMVVNAALARWLSELYSIPVLMVWTARAPMATAPPAASVLILLPIPARAPSPRGPEIASAARAAWVWMLLNARPRAVLTALPAAPAARVKAAPVASAARPAAPVTADQARPRPVVIGPETAPATRPQADCTAAAARPAWVVTADHARARPLVNPSGSLAQTRLAWLAMADQARPIPRWMSWAASLNCHLRLVVMAVQLRLRDLTASWVPPAIPLLTDRPASWPAWVAAFWMSRRSCPVSARTTTTRPL